MTDYIDFLKEDLNDVKYSKKRQDFLQKYNGRQGEIRFYNNPDLNGNEIPSREKGLYVIEFWQKFNDKGEIVDCEDRKKQEKLNLISNKEEKKQQIKKDLINYIQSDNTIVEVNINNKTGLSGFFNINNNCISQLSSYYSVLDDEDEIEWLDEKYNNIKLKKENIKVILTTINNKIKSLWEKYKDITDKIDKATDIKELGELSLHK